jgi:hypothetical protein
MNTPQQYIRQYIEEMPDRRVATEGSTGRINTLLVRQALNELKDLNLRKNCTIYVSNSMHVVDYGSH